LTADIAERAARLHPSLRLRLADAVQAASTLAINAAALVTNDRKFLRVLNPTSSRLPGCRFS
jgi:predicted nucleic acid-binding protein